MSPYDKILVRLQDVSLSAQTCTCSGNKFIPAT